MRKRILFRKTICSLLALLMALSSLLVLPVLAAGEEGEATASDTTQDTSPGDAPADPTPSEEQAAGTEAPAETQPATEPETPATDESAGEAGTTETTEPSDKTTTTETTEPKDEADTGETTESADGTVSNEDGKLEDEATPKDEEKTDDAADTEEEAKSDDAADPEEEGKPDGEPEEQPDGADLDKDGEFEEDAEKADGEEIPEIEKTLDAELKELEEPELPEFEPVSFEDDCIALCTYAEGTIQTNLIFSGAPDKVFVLEVNDFDDYHFYYGETDIRGDVSVEIMTAADGFLVTLRVPFEFLEKYDIPLGGDDDITFAGQTYNVRELELPEGLMMAYAVQPAYEGITIDGNFDDWAGVDKIDVRNPNPYNSKITMQSAVVWDGDYVYIYLHVNDGNANAVGAVGTHGNGKFAITTDLGNTRIVQPDFRNGPVKVYGIDDALIAIDNYNWDPTSGHSTEIAIPTSRLPAYQDSISFGFYLGEPFYSNIVNLDSGVQSGYTNPSGFSCDGNFSEWTWYPHSYIGYATPGLQDSEPDGEAALYVENGILYGHVRTGYDKHLAEDGSEFLAAISIAFNGDFEYKSLPEMGNFYPKMYTQDGNTVVNEGTTSPRGITTYLISDIRETTPESGPFFGEMKIKVTGTVDEMEFAIDLAKVAEYIGCDANDFKTIHAQFGRIGQQWVTTAGTPTGPILGLALCFATVGGVYAVDRKKKKK